MARTVLSVFIFDDILASLRKGMNLGLQLGVENEFREIHDHLSFLVLTLPEDEIKHGYSFKLLDLVRELKFAAFDVDDLLEELSAEEALWQRQRKVRRLLRPIVRLSFERGMRDEIRRVSRQLRDLIVQYRSLLLTTKPFETRKTHKEECMVPFIGRDRQKRELMTLLLQRGSRERERNLSVLIVRGPPGIGKTALVKEVCSELEVSRHFDHIIWVDASPPYDANRMAAEIVATLTNRRGGAPEEERVMMEEKLLLEIGNLLDGRKKYLFVLDDLSVHVSEIRRWLSFLSFLVGGSTESKILVTTRDDEWMSSENSVSYLKGLTGNDSFELLRIATFKGQRLEAIIDTEKFVFVEMVDQKCSGNPLFLRAMGDYLSLQNSTCDWSSFLKKDYDSVSSMLFYGGYPYGHFGTMVMTYNDLPPWIIRCLGLCSLFPRGHAIDRQTLAELCIALGYVIPSNDQCWPEDDITDRLLKANLFRVSKFDNFGKVRSVVLRPEAEHLARFVAGWDCRAYRSIVELWTQGVEGARHISVRDYCDFSLILPLSRIRTFLHFIDDTSKCEEATWNAIISSLKKARVLDLHHMNVETVQQGIWKLKLLRYLDLSYNRRITMLPSAITDLPNLQTLKLSGCSALKEMPQDMRKMVSLRHLYIDGCRKLSFMPKGLGDLKFLNILTDFILPPDVYSSVNSSILTDLCELNDLRGSLRITNLSFSEHKINTNAEIFKIQGLLAEKRSLESVELRFANQGLDALLLEKLWPHDKLRGLKLHNYGGMALPEWMIDLSINLPNLVEVALIGCKYLDDYRIPEFGHLHHLKSLTIQGLPDLECMERGLVDARLFRNLTLLCIRDCPKLKFLPMIPRLARLTLVNVSTQLFRHPCGIANLKCLRIENIELLHYFPEEWLQDATNLEELYIGSCPKFKNHQRMNIPSLLKLTLSNVSEELFEQPCCLPKLKSLHLENIELLDHLSGWLDDLTNLKELNIRSSPSLLSLSLGMMYLKNLVSLTIWNCMKLDLRKDEWGNVLMYQQGLESLKFLTIYKATKMEYLPEWLSRAYALSFLCIRSCPNLVELPDWVVNLQWLELVHCPRLTYLPHGIYENTNNYPRKLSIVGCPLLPDKEKKHSRRL